MDDHSNVSVRSISRGAKWVQINGGYTVVQVDFRSDLKVFIIEPVTETRWDDQGNRYEVSARHLHVADYLPISKMQKHFTIGTPKLRLPSQEKWKFVRVLSKEETMIKAPDTEWKHYQKARNGTPKRREYPSMSAVLSEMNKPAEIVTPVKAESDNSGGSRGKVPSLIRDDESDKDSIIADLERRIAALQSASGSLASKAERPRDLLPGSYRMEANRVHVEEPPVLGFSPKTRHGYLMDYEKAVRNQSPAFSVRTYATGAKYGQDPVVVSMTDKPGLDLSDPKLFRSTGGGERKANLADFLSPRSSN
jgi:hypothetical protein